MRELVFDFLGNLFIRERVSCVGFRWLIKSSLTQERAVISTRDVNHTCARAL